MSEPWQPITREQIGSMPMGQWYDAIGELLPKAREHGVTSDLNGVQALLMSTQQFMEIQRLVVIAQAEEGTRKSCAELIDSLP